MRKLQFASFFFLAAGLCAAGWAQVPIIDGDGITLEGLKDKDVYVTVVLKDSLARQSNLQIIGVDKDFISVIPLDGRRTAYPTSMIKEIRVQKSKVDSLILKIAPGGNLTSEDEDIAGAAVVRALELYKASPDNQALRMKAAAVMAIGGNENALNYLKGMGAVNDVATAIEASTYLFIVGEEINTSILRQGLISGKRRTRATALRLAGLIGHDASLPDIERALQDPMEEIFPSAAIATGLLGHRSAIPTLVKTLGSLSKLKGDAAATALGMIGGADVIRQMQELANTKRGSEKVWALLVLYKLGEEDAGDRLRDEVMRDPAFADKVAILLASNGDWDATQYLRERLDRPVDPSLENLAMQARMAAALFESGYAPARSTLQRLLTISESSVYAPGKSNDDAYKERVVKETQTLVCNLIASIRTRNLMSLTRPAIGSPIPEVALAACEAAVAIANPEFGRRLDQTRF